MADGARAFKKSAGNVLKAIRYVLDTKGAEKYGPIWLQLPQLAGLLTFLVLGKVFLQMPVTWVEIASIVAFGTLVEHALYFFEKRRLDFFSISGVLSSLGVVFMMRSPVIWVYFAALFVGLAQKHLLRINGKHFLNPSNVAVAFGLWMFPDLAYVTPYQWGSAWWLSAIMLPIGLFVTYRSRRWIIPFAFLVSFWTFSLFFLTHNLSQVFLRSISGGFLLFVFFMLTDPRATPDSKKYQTLFSVLVAFLFACMDSALGMSDAHPFYSLFFISPLVIFFRKFENGPRPLLPLAVLVLIVSVCISAFAISPWNYLGRVGKLEFLVSYDNASGDQTMPSSGATLTGAVDAKKYFQSPDSSAFQTHWEDGTVVERPLNVPKTLSGPNGFFPTDNAISQSKVPEISGKYAGFDFVHYSGISLGDLNRDGFSDVVTNNPLDDVRIWISTGTGGYADISSGLFHHGAPNGIDLTALADMDGDSWLDLVVIPNKFQRPDAKGTIYFFDSEKIAFDSRIPFSFDIRKSPGGITFTDYNGDGVLDFYVSYGRDLYFKNQQQFAYASQQQDSFFVSDKGWLGSVSWHDRLELIWPHDFPNRLAGMTTLFTDLNRDGRADFLLGNDASDPSLTLLQTPEGNFEQIPKESIEYNTVASMSYFTADFDNDGEVEIWENGIAQPSNTHRLLKTGEKGDVDPAVAERSLFSGELRDFVGLYGNVPMQFLSMLALSPLLQDSLKEKNCDDFKHPFVRSICKDKIAYSLAMEFPESHSCDSIANMEVRIRCSSSRNPNLKERFDPNALAYQAEHFPKQLLKNVLLKREASGKYVNAYGTETFPIWSWGSFAYDVNNDGLQDLYITNGYSAMLSQGSNQLQMSNLSKDGLRFENRAKELGVDFVGDDPRSVVVEDFDRDGKGDILANSVLSGPRMFSNSIRGGVAVEVDLRAKRGDYFGLGSKVELVTDKRTMYREVKIGGGWGVCQGYSVHFGLTDDEVPKKMIVTWTDGTRQEVQTVKPSHSYVVYQSNLP